MPHESLKQPNPTVLSEVSRPMHPTHLSVIGARRWVLRPVRRTHHFSDGFPPEGST